MSPTIERSAELEPVPGSAAEARRLVREVLDACGRSEWTDAAELAVSELVTNVVMHAHTPARLTVQCDRSRLRVEVCDESAILPAARQYGEHATTGRGMTLVAAMTSAVGTDSFPGGKTVWFTIVDAGAAAPPSAPDDPIRRGDGDEGIEPEVAQARLLALPPTLWLAAVQHQDGLLRELALYRAGLDLPTDDLAAADRARFAVGQALDVELAAASERGHARSPLPEHHPATLDAVPPTVDLQVLLLGPDPSADFCVLQDVLDEAERLAGTGLLLARPGLPEIVAVRDWVAESVIAQLAGQPPAAWGGTEAERFAQVVGEAPEIDWNLAVVAEADRGAVAADDANRILAVSRPLARALGWTPEELVGRRVVAIVPPELREAHVAGFTRHLTTGQAHALDVHLELPVLRADGTRVQCDFLIEAHRTDRGRSVYIAWITPQSTGRSLLR